MVIKSFKLEVPTIFYESARVVKNAIEKYQPDIVIDVGQAGGRAAITSRTNRY